jgi:6-phosphogluconolactonase
MAITDPEGRHLLVPTLGLDQVQVYRIDHRSGSLIRHDPPFFSLPEGAGPRHLAFSPDQKWLCVINELGWSLTRFRYDGDTGRADRPFSIAAMAGHVGQGSCAHVEVSRDGRFVYGSNRGHDSIVVCRAEAEGLVAIAHETAGGEIKVPRHFTLDPRGAYLLAASQGADYVTVLAVDPASGLLSKVHRVSCGDKPSFVGFLPPAPR